MKLMVGTIGLVVALALIVGLEALSGLIIWGIANLFIMAFNIDFTFTYLMGLATAFVLSIISSVLKR